jgi:hypothetical protein
MDINWAAPFILAFELGMFLLGWVLVLLIVVIAAILVFGVIKSAIAALSGSKKKTREFDPNSKAIRKLFSVKD